MVVEAYTHNRTKEMIDPLWEKLKGESDEMKEYFVWELAKRLVYSEYPILNVPNKRFTDLENEFIGRVLLGSLAI